LSWTRELELGEEREIWVMYVVVVQPSLGMVFAGVMVIWVGRRADRVAVTVAAVTVESYIEVRVKTCLFSISV
jgi:hypothetical protein